MYYGPIYNLGREKVAKEEEEEEGRRKEEEQCKVKKQNLTKGVRKKKHCAQELIRLRNDGRKHEGQALASHKQLIAAKLAEREMLVRDYTSAPAADEQHDEAPEFEALMREIQQLRVNLGSVQNLKGFNNRF